MVKDHLKEPFQLVLKEYLDVCPRGRHAHTFFELIYIVSGTGVQSINELQMPYREGDLFLVPPNDNHLFTIHTTTQFFFIRFNTAYIQNTRKDDELLQHLEIVLQNSRNEPESILNNEPDRLFVGSLMERIIREHLANQLYSKELIKQLVNTLLVIVARNSAATVATKAPEGDEQKILEVLQYIQSNIYYPDRLRVDAIAKALSISAHYLSRYFKKHTGETLQEYILSYKFTLIGNRLRNSNLRMKEIADEFGFTDKSHMSRAFKKYKGVNPSDFKKNRAL